MVGLINFLILALAPLGSIVAAAVSFYGAYHGWHWEWWQAALLCFPFAILSIATLVLQGSANVFDGLVERRGPV
ncbi:MULTISPECIES: hypothetical protein [unclassified Bradyrhizobium]